MYRVNFFIFVFVLNEYCQLLASKKILQTKLMKIKGRYKRILLVMGVTLIMNIIIKYYNENTIDYDIKCDNKWRNTNASLTVVTAYFDLGEFRKGFFFFQTRTPDSYKNWMKVFKYLKNPLIIYTDSKEFAEYCTYLRHDSTSSTKVIILQREKLWSFQIKPQIEKIYSNPKYPKHHPNTLFAEYTSMTHSKLTLVVNAIVANYFPADYYCWIDLGYFRDIVDRNYPFVLEIPEDFNNSRIAVTRVYNSNLNDISAHSVILENKNWLSGGLFLGKPEVFKAFEKQYKNRVFYYLSQGLMSVEQQIMYAMYTTNERQKYAANVDIQLYIPGTRKVICRDPWFYLGYLMYHEVSNSTNTNKIVS